MTNLTWIHIYLALLSVPCALVDYFIFLCEYDVMCSSEVTCDMNYACVLWNFSWSCVSNFYDVFDEEHFIHTLAKDVKVVKKLPKELMTTAKAVVHFRSWSGLEYYQNDISKMWDNHMVYWLESEFPLYLLWLINVLFMFLRCFPEGYQSC